MHARQRGKKANCQTFPSKCQVYLCLKSGEHIMNFLYGKIHVLRTDAFFLKNSILQEYIKIANIFISTK